MTDDPIDNAELEMTTYAADVTTEALEVMKAMLEASRTGRAVWRWGTGDPFDTIEAARAIRQFPPSARPHDRPDDVPAG